MISSNFTNLTQAMAKGQVNFSTGAFKAMLVAVAPTEANLDTWTVRQDVLTAGVEASGASYTSGGATISATVGAADSVNNRTAVTFGNPAPWLNSSITAVGFVFYLSTGNAANDILIGYVDFGGSQTSVTSTFTASFLSPLYLAR